VIASLVFRRAAGSASTRHRVAPRAAAGIGGEIRVDWRGGPQWIDANLPVRTALGGTAAHAARLLTLLGAPALLAIGHRGPEQLSLLDPDIRLAIAGRPVPASEVTPQGRDRLRVYIFEFTAGESFGGLTPPRSTRIFVRFHDLELEGDEDFARLGPSCWRPRRVPAAAFFNGLGDGAALDAGLAYARAMAQSRKDACIGLIHLEMAGYESPDCRDKAIAGLTGSVTSIGMSLSEFRGIDPSAGSLREGLLRLGNHLGLERVSVHADDWAISATRRDTDQEREALMMGCLLASARAATGGPVVPSALPPGAHFVEPPAGETHNGWHILACPQPASYAAANHTRPRRYLHGRMSAGARAGQALQTRRKSYSGESRSWVRPSWWWAISRHYACWSPRVL
jgi:hypothetical protein